MSDLTSKEQAELVALRIEVRELRELVAEYEREGEDADQARAIRLAGWSALMHRPQGSYPTAHRIAARTVDALVNSRGRVLSSMELIDRIRVDTDHWPHLAMAGNAITVTRWHLAEIGLAGVIETVRGVGWRLPVEYRSRVLSVLNDSARRAAA